MESHLSCLICPDEFLSTTYASLGSCGLGNELCESCEMHGELRRRGAGEEKAEWFSTLAQALLYAAAKAGVLTIPKISGAGEITQKISRVGLDGH